MKHSLVKWLILFPALFPIISLHAQDTIFMKDGSKIASKVVEITPDWVKYKSWSYKDGPTYYIFRLDVSSIKYPNGSIDDFNTQPVVDDKVTHTPDKMAAADDKFIGEWFPCDYDGSSEKSKLNIRKMGNDYLVEFSSGEATDSTPTKNDGSFKELGRLVGNSIEINSQLKLSLIDSSYILMNNTDFLPKEGLVTVLNGAIEKSKNMIKSQQIQIDKLKQKIDELSKQLRSCPSGKVIELTDQIRTITKKVDEEEMKLKGLNDELIFRQKKTETVIKTL